MRLLLLLLAAVTLCAQTPEIYGTIIEIGPNTPLPGVKVTLTGFVPANDTLEAVTVATTFTDQKGKFSLKPPSLGEYRLDIEKAGYRTQDRREAQSFVILTPDRPTAEFRKSLMNPSGLTGTFLDDQDKPLVGLQVTLQPVQGMLSGAPTNITTDAEGRFTVDGVPPGDYHVRAFPRDLNRERILEFSEAEATKVDRALHNAFWPSGLTDIREALPVTIPPGAVGNMGNVRIRLTDYYRLHVSVDGDCSGRGWKYAIVPLPQRQGIINFGQQPLNCATDFLVRDLQPGSYEFALWKEGERMIWSLTPFAITNRNVAIKARLNEPIDVAGRFVPSEGGKLPSFKNSPIAIFLDLDSPGLPGGTRELIQINEYGTFLVRNLAWQKYRVVLAMRRASFSPPVPATPPPAPVATHYMRQILYGRQLMSDERISLTPGSPLEIELDDRPSMVTGTVKENDQPVIDRVMVIMARMPLSERLPFHDMSASQFFSAPPEGGGAFEFTGLAPGEYRVIALASDEYMGAQMNGRLNALIGEGERVVLERGQHKQLDLRIR